MTGRRGRRSRKLLDDLTERKGYSHLKEEALDRTMWIARCGGGFGPVVRQTAKRINSLLSPAHGYTDLLGTLCCWLRCECWLFCTAVC